MSPSKPARIVFGTASFGTGTSQAKFNSPETALSVLSVLRARGITDIDTARAYPVGSPGTAEVLLGAVSAHEWATISTKVTSWMPGAHAVQNIAASVDSSLAALGVDKVDIMYLHAPDRTTPFEETCRAMDAEWRKGKFARFGISNYRADEVEEIVSICERAGLVKPSVYQGRYNAIIRSGEEKLFPVLRKHGIAFYAYSPTAAGIFSGKVTSESINVPGSRWDSNTRLGVAYKEAYLKPALLSSAARVSSAAQAAHLDGHAVALRWTIYHSILDGAHGDAVVLGASSLDQLERNLGAIEDGPLEEEMVELVQGVWESVRESAAEYCL